jgi:hypothetical protein
MSANRNWVIIVGLVAVLAVGLWLVRPASTQLGPPYQTSGRGPFGLSGLDAGLRAAGVRTHDRDAPTLAGGGLTIAVEPVDVTHDEAASWRRSLRAGATLIYAVDRADPFTSLLGVRFVHGAQVTPARWASAFQLATTPAFTARAATVPHGARAVYYSGHRAAFEVIPVGKGAVWLFTDPRWLTNGRVQYTGLPMVLPIAWSTGRSAGFDVYHRKAGGNLNVLTYLPQVWTLLAVEGALAGLLLVSALLRRRGPVWPERIADPADDLSLAPSLAALYSKNNHAAAMASALASADQRRLGARAAAVQPQLERLRSADDSDQAVKAWHDLQEAERR